MTKRQVTDYEVEKKEVTETVYECDVEGCFAEIEPSNITTVNYEHAKSNSDSVTEKHLCPEHTDVPELVSINKRNGWLRAIGKGLGEVSLNVVIPVLVFVVTAWAAFSVGAFYVVTDQGPVIAKLFVGVVLWLLCAAFTFAILDGPQH
jgi:hypothetical protein